MSGNDGQATLLQPPDPRAAQSACGEADASNQRARTLPSGWVVGLDLRTVVAPPTMPEPGWHGMVRSDRNPRPRPRTTVTLASTPSLAYCAKRLHPGTYLYVCSNRNLRRLGFLGLAHSRKADAMARGECMGEVQAGSLHFADRALSGSPSPTPHGVRGALDCEAGPRCPASWTTGTGDIMIHPSAARHGRFADLQGPVWRTTKCHAKSFARRLRRRAGQGRATAVQGSPQRPCGSCCVSFWPQRYSYTYT